MFLIHQNVVGSTVVGSEEYEILILSDSLVEIVEEVSQTLVEVNKLVLNNLTVCAVFMSNLVY